MESAVPRPAALRAWRNAMFAVFGVCGVGLSTWAARIPAIQEDLELSTAGVAVLLFGLSAGAIAGLVVAPWIIWRQGTRRAQLLCVLGFAFGLAVAGLGASVLQSKAVTFVGLALFGFFYASMDVVMNVEGAAAERAIGRTVLPLMHAFFSFGTIAGAALGAGAASIGLPVVWNFLLACALIVLANLWAIRHVPDTPSLAEEPTNADSSRRDRIRASMALWKDPVLLLIGVMMVGMAFSEGAANDWLALATVDGHSRDAATGAIVYGMFVAGMTIGRVAGGPLIDRWGRAAVPAAMACVGIFGIVAFILTSESWLMFLGASLWGLGASLGFPVGMSAAADHPTDGPQRVSIVAIFGYGAFLASPPALGLLGEHVGILNAFYLVAGLLVVSLLATPAARQRRTEKIADEPRLRMD
jgi:MFS family permease